MEGSMMRRLNAALELLIDNGAIPALTDTAKQTAAPERKR